MKEEDSLQFNDRENGISFREYLPEDYEPFLACINDFYRGGYPYKEYLDPDYLAKETRSGNMIVTVAVTEGGKIVGTSAAQRASGAFYGSVLLLLRCVLSEYRGKGIGSRQEYYLFDLISKRFADAISLYADVMTHDAASQKTLVKNGFTLCGLRMMLYKNDVIVPALGFPAGTKMTQAIYCKAMRAADVSLCKIPEHLEAVRAIYESLGVGYGFVEDGGVRTDSSQFSYQTVEIHKKTEFTVDTVGKDFDDTLIKCVKEKLRGGQTLVAYINLCRDGCGEAVRKLKAEGFFFSGMKPLSASGEYLVMSHIKNCVSSFDIIKVPEDKQKFLDDVIGGIGNEE